MNPSSESPNMRGGVILEPMKLGVKLIVHLFLHPSKLPSIPLPPDQRVVLKHRCLFLGRD